MKRYIWGLAVLCLVFGTISGCGGKPEVSYSQLISQPEKYDGQTVTVECFYFDAFEMMALCASLGPSTIAPGNLAPQGEFIWLEGGLPLETRDKLYTQTVKLSSGYPEHYGKVRITGRFQSGGQFGHLGAYKYQITISEVSLLEWSP
jgi:hypothetical protein